MQVEHLAIDGSVVVIEAQADLNTRVTATGWAIVPSLMRSHPFSVSPPGHSKVIEQTVRSSVSAVTVLASEDYRLKNGTLRIAEIRLPTATGGVRELTVGGWEGDGGCLSTSVRGRDRNGLVEVFDTLEFSSRRGGLAIESPIMPQPRAPEVIKEIPSFGVLCVRPAIASELERVPRSRGFVTGAGELFRIRKSSQAVLLLTRTSITTLEPLGPREGRDVLELARTLRVEWTPPVRATAHY
jgi:hypothetical protein